MRTITRYIAYDDTEFTDRYECMEYEEEAINNLAEINRCYVFYDKNMNPIPAPSIDDEVDDWLDWICCSCDQCTYILRKEQLSREAETQLHKDVGYCILNVDFNDELGMFKWDPNKIEWIKVDE